MTILTTMRIGTIALILGTASLVQGCASPDPGMPRQQAALSAPGPYSGAGWYADLAQKMTADNGGD
jgi:hypothetical protein